MQFVILLACVLINHASYATEIVNVLTSSSSSCPGTQCMTLDQFAANPGQTAGSNLTVIFENGTHSLNSRLTLTNLHTLTLTATGATIRCYGGDLLSFPLVDHVMLSDLIFRGCSGTFSDIGKTATFSNLEFLDGGRIHIRSVAETVLFTDIYFARGSPFDFLNISKILVTNSTFEDGRGHLYISDFSQNGGIYDLEIIDSNFHGSRDDREAAIAFKVRDTSTLNISGCNFTNNLQAISCGGFLTLENSSFSNNVRKPGQGGAIHASRANIANCYFFQNQAEGGGAIFIYSTGYGTITDTVFDSNTASYGGVIVSPIVEATRCVFVNNVASIYGGVYSHYGEPRSITFIDCSFVNNTVTLTGESGGVIQFISYHPGVPGNIALINSTFRNNSAPSCGVVNVPNVYTDHLNITECTFTHNRATAAAVLGGGVACIRNTSISIQSSEFSHNSAATHAGVFNIEQCTMTVSDSEFHDNSATYDGGVFYSLVHTSTYEISRSIFSFNLAGDDGGVLYLGQSGNLAIFISSNFSWNNATDRGGVIAVTGSTIYVLQSNIMENTASNGPLISACNSAVIVPEDIWNSTDPDEPNCVLYDGYINFYDIESVSPSVPNQELSRLIPPPDDVLLETTYIAVSPESSCPGEFSGVPCYTLEQLTINMEGVNRNHKGNVTLTFESGMHSLNSRLTLTNLHHLTINSSDVTIRCYGGDLLRFPLVDHVMISGVIFRGCSGTFSDIGITATLSNMQFLDSGRIHIRSVAETVLFTDIYFARGSPFDFLNISKILVTNSTFEDGRGHLYISDFSQNGGIYDLEIIDSNFHGSRDDREAAIAFKVRDTSTLNISGCNFTNNLQAISCGGFLTLENSSFSNNVRKPGQGGAIHASRANIANCYFFQNQAEGGGAIFIYSTGYGTITDTVFDSNTASYGGVIVSPIVEATRCVFVNNVASTYGGVYSHYGEPRSITFIDCSFVNNTVTLTGESGGVIQFISYHPGAPGNIALINSTFRNNSAPSCGVVNVPNVYTDHLNITECTFTHNRATAAAVLGGGVACIRNTSVSIQSSEFSHNTAATHAGVLNLEECNVTVWQSIFFNNSATDNGGVMYNNEYSTNYDIYRSVFSHNSAGSDGGVLFVGLAGSILKFSRSNFTNNDATERGGVISLVGSSLQINETNMYDNTASVGSTISACDSTVILYDDVSMSVDPNAPTCVLYDLQIDSYDVTLLDDEITTPLATTEEIITETPTTTEEITTETPTTTEEITTETPTTDEEITMTQATITTGETVTTQQDPTTTEKLAATLAPIQSTPPPPANCSSVPVYNEEGTLISIYFSWDQDDIPQEITIGSSNNLSIQSYTLFGDGFGTHTVPTQAVCDSTAGTTCSYSYLVQHFSLPNREMQVYAENMVGRGKMCSLKRPQTTLQISSVFLTVMDSSDAKTKLLECSHGAIGTNQTFKCEFCYSIGRSCQSSLTCLDVIPGSGSATLLPLSLAEGTYCYRATAIVDETPARMIQDTFTIHPCQNTEATQSTIFTLPITASISAAIALLVCLPIAYLFGACSVYMCMRQREPKKLLPCDANTMKLLRMPHDTNMGDVDGEYGKTTVIALEQDMDDTYADINESTELNQEEKYEDVEEVRKTYFENRNEFELSENNAYCNSHAEDVTDYNEDVYEN